MNDERVKVLKKTLGANIRKARTRQGITQEQMAELLEMSPEVYGRMERGLIFPRVERLLDICEKLGVSSDQLLGLSSPDVSTAAAARQDEWLTVLHRFTPMMPRLTQFQRQAVRRHVTDFQRLLVSFLEPEQAQEVKPERPERLPT
ncbi:helix-turn-helix transcriptional regulator [Hyalangium sp.]|uniref:helix-turn-helix domain-containing protein n=1 Tax=Hyalangium sp. TaxID=2028555 RepID=UPI002D362CBE|nr:helix-turn-helix transcriptional regulator [Hyalangium sp.]HYH95717.1 helix-turn-helix transcriptional regulator [Hyalangium sp.]